jgi:hypothetical protein
MSSDVAACVWYMFQVRMCVCILYCVQIWAVAVLRDIAGSKAKQLKGVYVRQTHYNARVHTHIFTRAHTHLLMRMHTHIFTRMHMHGCNPDCPDP